ncbi:GNAT family N-acetyltransferase [Acidipropionibacterium virtanenii]|uniref:GNAT family N-acetyltransferase n=1 Tax=Acidipropionibacterium virtanenii TaxID=2057246 RepID=UPI0015F00C6C|nr:GNAT family N-acetyltransferase [Acidipropionibacterium virtanenii]
MLAAYRGTPDDEGETLEDTVEVIRSTMDGGFGRWLAEASFLAFDVGTGAPIGAILIAREHDGTPFIAFVFIHPGKTGNGVASALISHVCRVLSEAGMPELRLWVSAANKRALRLYRHLGFE